MTDRPTCSLPGCEKPAKPRRLQCSMHIARKERHGDPSVVLKERHLWEGACSIEGCPKPGRGKFGYCEMHATRVSRHGSPHVVKVGGPDASYGAAHRRVGAARGPASAHPCFSCGRPAMDWAYQGGAPDERYRKPEERLFPYSSDPAYYEPMCRVCHYAHDRARIAERGVSC